MIRSLIPVTVQGLSCYWEDYEALEILLESAVTGTRMDPGSRMDLGSATSRMMSHIPLMGSRSESVERSLLSQSLTLLAGGSGGLVSEYELEASGTETLYSSEHIGTNREYKGGTGSSSIRSGGGSGVPRRSWSTVDGARPGPHSVATDPYTYGLLRYASAESTRVGCERACPSTVSLLSGTESRLAVTGDSDGIEIEDSRVNSSIAVAHRIQESVIQGPLRVGYISFDFRNHPIGRLVKTLLTGHNASKVMG